MNYLRVKLELNQDEDFFIFDIDQQYLDHFRKSYLTAICCGVHLEVAAYKDGIPYELIFTAESLVHSIMTIKRDDLMRSPDEPGDSLTSPLQ
jgi:hypothetical protein